MRFRGCRAVRFESVRLGVRFGRFGSDASGLMRGSVRFGGVRFGSGCSTGSVRLGFCHDDMLIGDNTKVCLKTRVFLS